MQDLIVINPFLFTFCALGLPSFKLIHDKTRCLLQQYNSTMNRGLFQKLMSVGTGRRGKAAAPLFSAIIDS